MCGPLSGNFGLDEVSAPLGGTVEDEECWELEVVGELDIFEDPFVQVRSQ